MRKLLFFHAPWCSPCRFYTGQFIEPLEQLAGTEQVIRINAQNEPFMAKKYRVDKLPTVILLVGDTVLAAVFCVEHGISVAGRGKTALERASQTILRGNGIRNRRNQTAVAE